MNLTYFSEMTQWLRVLASLPEDPSSILNMCSKLPVTSAPEISNTLFWSLPAHTGGTCAQLHIHQYQSKNEYLVYLKIKFLGLT